MLPFNISDLVAFGSSAVLRLSGVCLVFVWCLSGVCLVFVWCLSGVCLVFVWCFAISYVW